MAFWNLSVVGALDYDITNHGQFADFDVKNASFCFRVVLLHSEKHGEL